MKKVKQLGPSVMLRHQEGFYTIKELAERLKVATSTVCEWVKLGTVAKPSHKWRHHTRRYYSAADIENILKFLRGECDE